MRTKRDKPTKKRRKLYKLLGVANEKELRELMKKQQKKLENGIEESE